MKDEPKPSFYFSAYRLKTLEKAVSSSGETNQSPYLKAMLSGKAKTMSRVRVSPMLNPYKQRNAVIAEPGRQMQKPEETIVSKEKNWFHNYE